MDYQQFGVGLAIILVVWRLNHNLRQELRQDLDRVGTRLDRLEDWLSKVEQGQARLESLLEGLRDLFGRTVSGCERVAKLESTRVASPTS